MLATNKRSSTLDGSGTIITVMTSTMIAGKLACAKREFFMDESVVRLSNGWEPVGAVRSTPDDHNCPVAGLFVLQASERDNCSR